MDSRDFPPETAREHTSLSFRVVNPYIILSEREVLSLLSKENPSMTRLPKYLSSDLAQCKVPSAENPSVFEVWFFCSRTLRGPTASWRSSASMV